MAKQAPRVCAWCGELIADPTNGSQKYHPWCRNAAQKKNARSADSKQLNAVAKAAADAGMSYGKYVAHVLERRAKL